MSKDFEETAQRMQSFAEGSPELRAVFNGRILEDLQQAVHDMSNDIGKAIEEGDDAVEKEPEKLDRVYKVLDVFLKRVFTQRVPDNVNNFMSDFLKTAHNYNKLYCSDKLAEIIICVQRQRRYHESTIATIETMKRLLEVAEMYKDFQPPAFKLSKHYFDSIQEELEDGSTSEEGVE